MKFIVDKLLFLSTLEKIDTLVSSRDIQTLLANIVIRTEGDKIFLISSDMENTAQIYFKAESVIEEGEVIVKAKKLSDILRNIVGSEINFQAKQELIEEEKSEKQNKPAVEEDNEYEEDSEYEKENIFHISIYSNDQNSAKYKMTGMGTENFPHVNILSSDKLFSLPSAMLKEMIKKTLYSISHEDNRYIYNGLCFQFQGQSFTIIGTDGRRLSAVKRQLANSIHFSNVSQDSKDDNNENTLIIHGKAVKELLQLLENSEEIFIGKENRDVFFQVNNAELSSRLLDGKFPEYEKVIPDGNEAEITCNVKSIKEALSQIMVMTQSPSFQMNLLLNVEKKIIKLTAGNSEIGFVDLQMDVECKGKDLEIYLNAMFLNDILRNVDCETLRIELTNSMKPIIIKNPEDKDFISLIMPIGN